MLNGSFAVNTMVLVATAPTVFVAATVNVWDVSLVVVPLITPPALNVIPVGSDPDWMENVAAPVPPLTARVCVYAAPTSKLGSVFVVMSSAGLIVTDSTLVALAPAASVAVTVNVGAPAAAGVPLITPAVLKVNPPGNEPAVTAQLTGDVPPVEASGAEYAAPAVPADSVVVVTDSTGLIVNVNEELCAVK